MPKTVSLTNLWFIVLKEKSERRESNPHPKLIRMWIKAAHIYTKSTHLTVISLFNS